MQNKIRVRYAPSPTGFLHIGNARTALFNYLFAKRYNGSFIIRIEDTDLLRNIKDSEKSQIDHLKWLGISWQEGPDIGGDFGPYRQSERLLIYQKYAHQLLRRGIVYKDYKTNQQNYQSDNYSLRFKVISNKVYSFQDLIRGKVTFHSKDIEDWVILKENGWPTYNFAVVIDDFLMGISHIFRGEEHITNTPKQLMLYEVFGWKCPQFAHMTLILNENRKKLSKRDSDIHQFIEEYMNLGYLPEALFNFLSFLGFSPKVNKEILLPTEIINLFNENYITRAPAVFDKQKLNFINSQHIKKLSFSTLVQLSKKHLEKKDIFLDDVFLNKMMMLLQNRISYLEEIVVFYQNFLNISSFYNMEIINVLKRANILSILATLHDCFQKIEFNASMIETTFHTVAEMHHTKIKSFLKFVRMATTFQKEGPSLPLFLELLSRKKVLYHLEKIMTKISS